MSCGSYVGAKYLSYCILVLQLVLLHFRAGTPPLLEEGLYTVHKNVSLLLRVAAVMKDFDLLSEPIHMALRPQY